MNVKDEEEEQLEQPERQFEVVSRVHVSNHPPQPQHSEELQHRKKDKLLSEVLIKEHLENDFEGYTGKQIDPESAKDVVDRDPLGVGDFITCEDILVRRAEVEDDVCEEDAVYNIVSHLYSRILEEFRFECNFHWQAIAAPNAQNNDEQVPFDPEWVVLL